MSLFPGYLYLQPGRGLLLYSCFYHFEISNKYYGVDLIQALLPYKMAEVLVEKFNFSGGSRGGAPPPPPPPPNPLVLDQTEAPRAEKKDVMTPPPPPKSEGRLDLPLNLHRLTSTIPETRCRWCR